jgi:acetoin utilization deacetylase AcuC-like enzyme
MGGLDKRLVVVREGGYVVDCERVAEAIVARLCACANRSNARSPIALQPVPKHREIQRRYLR